MKERGLLFSIRTLAFDIINEGGNFGGFPQASFREGLGGGGGGVPMQPGQLSVNVQVQVTFSVNR